MRMAGPREALMNAIIRQNYGCSHYIVGTEHAAPPNVREMGKRFYAAGAAQKYIHKYRNDIEIEIVTIDELCYNEEGKKFISKLDKSTGNNKPSCSNELFSHNRIIDTLLEEEEIPHWVTYPNVLKALQQSYPPRHKRGLTLFFTGFSGSGKSTLARIIYAKFIEEDKRPVTLLDGDVVRLNLSSELGFSKKDRNTNVRRIGYVASEITKNRGVAICAPIAPYKEIRREVRNKIEEYGAFIEIHVSTSIEECEGRDRKGLYAKARKGIIPEFTGISDPYDIPESPEIRVDTGNVSPVQAAQEIYLYLIREGYI
jgi:sulfate adenylyltransferase